MPQKVSISIVFVEIFYHVIFSLVTIIRRNGNSFGYFRCLFLYITSRLTNYIAYTEMSKVNCHGWVLAIFLKAPVGDNLE